MRPIGIALFAGAGGMSLGVELAGIDVAAAVEFDPVHCATHEYNFPRCRTICRDVAGLRGREIRDLANLGSTEIDVVFGGPPCQGFSAIGKRSPEDARNALVHEFVRLVSELRPVSFVFENVQGLASDRFAGVLADIQDDLRAVGYRIASPVRILNAADHGVPQDRRRLFLLGARGDHPVPNYPEPSKQKPDVWDAIGDLPEVDEYPELLECDSVRVDLGVPSRYARRMRGQPDAPSGFAHPRAFDRSVVTCSQRTRHAAEQRRRFASTPVGRPDPVSRSKRLDPDGVCGTLRSGTASDHGAFTSPRPIHPFAPRCITMREAGRLHSYPDWFRFHATKWHGLRQIGNSVPPLLAEAVAGEIMKALGRVPQRPEETLELGDPRLLQMSMTQASAYYGVPSDIIPQRRRRRADPPEPPNDSGAATDRDRNRNAGAATDSTRNSVA